MPAQDRITPRPSQRQVSAIATQGRSWRFTEQTSAFRLPSALLDPPMEITPTMIRGLRMVDETVIVHGARPSIRNRRGQKDAGGK